MLQFEGEFPLAEFDLSFFQNFGALGILSLGAAILAGSVLNLGVNLYQGEQARKQQRRAVRQAEARQRELDLEERDRAFRDSMTASLLAGQTRRPRGRTGIRPNGQFGGPLTGPMTGRTSSLGGGRSLLGA